jgi:hypothetical protein
LSRFQVAFLACCKKQLLSNNFIGIYLRSLSDRFQVAISPLSCNIAFDSLASRKIQLLSNKNNNFIGTYLQSLSGHFLQHRLREASWPLMVLPPSAIAFRSLSSCNIALEKPPGLRLSYYLLQNTTTS